jgi:hypothetical protein
MSAPVLLQPPNSQPPSPDLRPPTSDLRPPISEVQSPSSDLRPPSSAPEPPPALLAICSDLDETPDAETYFELMRFLNTTEETSMGPGVGLEVGNTIYFDMAPGQFSYWNTTEENREKIRALIRSGHIDCLHSYGDLATTRAHAARALEELQKHGCQLRVWIDHAQAVTNLGADIMQGHGDEPGHPAYHADLTLQYGIQYVWRGRVTSVIGQDRPFSLRGIADWRHPVASVKTLAKESVKQVFARSGHPKYALQSGNRLLKPVTLRDGRQTMEFLRSDPFYGGISRVDRGDAIHEVLTPRFLDRLAGRGGNCILYTHLGKLERGPHRRTFRPEVAQAFQLLAVYQSQGRIQTLTTARLLASALSAASPPAAPLQFPAH